METNKAINKNLLNIILSVVLISKAIQGRVRNPPENLAKKINVITGPYDVASTIKYLSNLIEVYTLLSCKHRYLARSQLV